MTEPILISRKPAYSQIVTRIDKGLNDLLYGACSYEVANAEHIIRATGGGRYRNWDGWKRLYQRSRRTFPTGLLERVLGILREQGRSWVVTPESVRPGPCCSYRQIPDEYALWPFQGQALLTMLEARRCMVQVATGGGKTVIAGHVIQRLALLTVFLVHTKDLLYQARTAFAAMLGEEVVGQVGDGVVQIREVTVCTLQTAARCLSLAYERDSYDEDEYWEDSDTATREEERWAVRHLLEAAQCVFMDECHRVAAPTAQRVVMAIEGAIYRFGLSASPWRDDGADMLLESAFGAVMVRVSASELIEEGYLVPPLIRFVTVPAVAYEKARQYHAIYGDYVVANPDRNQLVAARTADMIGRGRPTLVLVRMISHGYTIQRLLLERGIGLPFLSGKDTSTFRNQTLQDLRDGTLRGIIASTIADEGIDIKPLSGLVLAGGGKSSTRALQRIGRVLRICPGKRDAEVVDFEDNARFLTEHAAARLRIYRTEPAWTITDI